MGGVEVLGIEKRTYSRCVSIENELGQYRKFIERITRNVMKIIFYILMDHIS